MQIGPKIRVGGTLGKIGQQAKIGLGKLEQKAAPFVAMIPGLGPIASAAIAAHGRILDTSHGSVGLGDIGSAALKGGIGGLTAGGLSKIPGLSSVASHIPGLSSVEGALSHIPGLGGLGGGGLTLPNGGPTPFAGLDIGSGIGSGINDVANATMGGASGGGSGFLGSLGGAVSGGLQKLGGYAMQHPDQILAGANGVMGAMEAKKAGQLERDSLNRERAAYDAKQGIRDSANAGVQRAMTQLPDLSSTYARYSPTLMSGLRKVS